MSAVQHTQLPQAFIQRLEQALNHPRAEELIWEAGNTLLKRAHHFDVLARQCFRYETHHTINQSEALLCDYQAKWNAYTERYPLPESCHVRVAFYLDATRIEANAHALMLLHHVVESNLKSTQKLSKFELVMVGKNDHPRSECPISMKMEIVTH